jgi:uncharacterized protein (DUF2252 family)
VSDPQPRDGDPPAPELKTVEERHAEGQARRAGVPRSSHAGWRAPPDRPDPIALLEERHRSRVAELVPIRVGRMLVSPFTFLRGAAEVMAHDLACTPVSGLRVQACGDAHLLNFGVFATPERHLVFDVNDFDETLPAPWEWDVKRLAASVAVAGRGASFTPEQVDLAVGGMVRAYRVRMGELSTMAPLDIWYDRVDVDAVLAVARRQDTPSLPHVGHLLERARHHTSLAALPKLTELVDGQRRIIEDPPLILHADHGFDVARRAFDAYLASITRERRTLLDRYVVVDAARKVVGVGSVGTRCHVVLLMDGDGEAPLFLQIKQAEVSVLAPYAGPSEYLHQGERVVTGQRLMQAASDVFLGWADGPYGHQYYVRQLRDMKGSVSIDLLGPDELLRYAMLCGVTLARAHARSGDPAAIAGYLGTGDQFDRAIVAFADGYADQTVADHAALEQAVADGRIEAVRGR